MTTNPNLREYEVRARSTDIFGRVLVSARNHQFIIDGPVQNDCPGEAITPAESFLSGVAGCCIELMHVIARSEQAPLQKAHVKIHGVVDRDRQASSDVTLFNSVRLEIELTGVTPSQGESIVAGFRKRCPLYGTVATAVKDVVVAVKTLSS
jgi:uncharacterized OsmC-like protein